MLISPAKNFSDNYSDDTKVLWGINKKDIDAAKSYLNAKNMQIIEIKTYRQRAYIYFKEN